MIVHVTGDPDRVSAARRYLSERVVDVQDVVA
jgi:hypothetical protein